MLDMRNVTFHLGIGCLATHELDAVRNHEWRVLPLVEALPEEIAMVAFIAAHVPLFAVLFALVASPNERTRRVTRSTLGIFLVVHGLAHALSSGRADYEFSSTLSHLLIFGGAGFGALYLLLEARRRLATPR